MFKQAWTRNIVINISIIIIIIIIIVIIIIMIMSSSSSSSGSSMISIIMLCGGDPLGEQVARLLVLLGELAAELDLELARASDILKLLLLLLVLFVLLISSFI